jgi:hypothetical protein
MTIKLMFSAAVQILKKFFAILKEFNSDLGTVLEMEIEM